MKVTTFDPKDIEKGNRFQQEFGHILASPEESEQMLTHLSENFNVTHIVSVDIQPDSVTIETKDPKGKFSNKDR